MELKKLAYLMATFIPMKIIYSNPLKLKLKYKWLEILKWGTLIKVETNSFKP